MKRHDVIVTLLASTLLLVILFPHVTTALSVTLLPNNVLFRRPVPSSRNFCRGRMNEFHDRAKPIPPKVESTRIGLFPDQSAIMASMALVGSSAMGMKLDRWIPSSGIPITLATAAILSNLLPMVPISHPLYDMCWSWILPGSLAMLLLGYRTNPTPKDAPSIDDKTQEASEQQMIMQAIARVAGPFVLASIGSIVGCWIAFRLAMVGALFSSMDNARAAIACLAASYVGGSVNLFATAKIIRAPPSLLSSMATADLIAMALYFSVLSSTLEWKWLKSLFSQDYDLDMQNEIDKVDDMGTDSTGQVQSTSIKSMLTFVPLLLTVAGPIVALSNWVEFHLGRWVPGTACGVIAVVAPCVRSLWSKTSWAQDYSSIWGNTAAMLADWFFFLFFAAIGIGVDLKATIEMGPACLIVSVLALIVHLGVMVGGSRLLLPIKKWSITLEDLWIASNAAIGGPATAAAFCNRMKGANLVGRTVAATVWGVVGYAIGTVVGVSLFQLVGGTLP